MPTLPILYVDTRMHGHRQAMSLLDRTGVSYRLQDVKHDPAAAADVRMPGLKWGGHFLHDFNREQLAEFLWARGVKFEDS